MSVTYVVEVRCEDQDGGIVDTTVAYGPFRVRRTAVEHARRIGSKAGLNLNTWGDWYGTDGGDLVASVRIRPVIAPTTQAAGGAAADIRAFFTESH